ncbi:MAG: pilus assembly protein [Candidatus Limnocylindrales bacterium]
MFLVLRRGAGQGLAEYALILVLIAVSAVVAVTLFGSDLNQMLSVIGSKI